jgi:hypothetical protein
LYSPLAIGLSATGATLPVLFHGPKVYTNWIPELYRLGKGEAIRRGTGVPDVKKGLEGWQEDSTHSTHFNDGLARGIVGLCQKEKFTKAADFDCGGQGQYAEALEKRGVVVHGYDFSLASTGSKDSRNLSVEVKHTTLEADPSHKEQYELVTSLSDVTSKTLPGKKEEEQFCKKLIDATKSRGMIVTSCAIPGQPGPNSNCKTNKAIQDIFKKNGCTFLNKPTNRLRHLANPIHPWLMRSLMVFRKN